MDDLLREFIGETSERLELIDAELVRFEHNPDDGTLHKVFRLLHSIKGTCGFLGLPRLERLTHAAETVMGRFRDGMPVTDQAVTLILASVDRIKQILAGIERTGAEPEGSDDDLAAELERAALDRPGAALASRPEEAAAPPKAAPALSLVSRGAAGSSEPHHGPARTGAPGSQTIRVGVDILDQLMTMVSELVLTRNQLLELVRRHEGAAYNPSLQRLSQITAELQDVVMKARMQPIGSAWQKLPRLVRDLSVELGKEIDLVLDGAETEVDRQVLDAIRDPLMHLVRNAADHGLEPPAERRAAGKPERGTIRLTASQAGGMISIEIADDGRGLDHEALRGQALNRGLATAVELVTMPDREVARFIFHPGFSTAGEVSAVSGRGVGLDVVSSNVASIGGTVEVRSTAGQGTTFGVTIPLTLAIAHALIVAAGDRRFAVPQVGVLEVVRVGMGSDIALERIQDAPVLRLRDRLVPVVSIADLFGGPQCAAPQDDGFVVVSDAGGQPFGLLVDRLFHTEEIVVKPMGPMLEHVPFFSGHTVLGDGAVVLILDPKGIASSIGSAGEERRSGGPATPAAPEPATPLRLLLFRAGGPGLKAVPLSLVARLEEIASEAIEWTGNRAIASYGGRVLTILPAAPEGRIRSHGAQPVLIFSDGERSTGVAVDEVVDIVEEVVSIEPVADRPDLVGSAFVGGRPTEIIDVGHFMKADPGGWDRDPRASAGRTVLLVDDSAFFRDMLAPVLAAAGYAVIPAASADEALAIVNGRMPVDVLVTDMDMPGRSGFELVEAVRAGDRLGRVPVIALGSGVSRSALEQARRLRIADFVQKFDRPGLLAALAEARPTELGEAA